MKSMNIFLLLILSLSSLCAEIELIARANSYGSYNLPDSSYIFNSTIKNNAQGDSAFNFTTVVEEEIRLGLWLKNSYHPNGGTLFLAKPGDYISDPSFNNEGDMVFAVYNELEFIALYFYQYKSNDLVKLSIPNEGNILSLSDPVLNDQGRILFRLIYKSGEKTVATLKNGELVTVVSDKEDSVAYLFGASFINGDEVAIKVREGNSLSNSSPDTLRVYRASGDFTRVNGDYDYNEDSEFANFNNSLGSHFSSNFFSFVAKLTNGKRVLVRQLGREYKIIATEGEGGISTLEYFAPAINESGNIAFRAINENGKRAIFFYDGKDLAELATEGDLVSTDASTGVIHAAQGPVFGGGVSINKFNEIVVQARVYTKYLEQQLGTAVLKITP